VMKVCLHALSPCTSMELTEALYLLATYLRVMQTLYNLPPRPHYLLHYALFLTENQWTYDPSSHFTPQNVQTLDPCLGKTVQLTAEQKRIVSMDLRQLLGTTNTLRIMAYAGTGKTTTLVEMCARNPKLQFLLVVFNRSVRDHSVKVFPRNVIVKTANQLSWKYTTDTEGRDRINPWSMKYTDLIYNDILPFRKDYGGFSLYHWAAMVMNTLTAFYNSDSDGIELKHSPSQWQTTKVGPPKPVDERKRRMLVTDATEVWDTLRQGRNRKVKYDYDSSMKAFQLSGPDLQMWAGRHDILLIDEAQDMNPTMLDVCLKQNTPKIVVGDPYQQIYSFRGAVNALEMVKDHPDTKVTKNLYLTQSFRFGAEIGFLANCCLDTIVRKPGEEGPMLVASAKQDSITARANPRQKEAVLARTNLGLFEKMVDLVCRPDAENRPNFAFPTDPSNNPDPMGWNLLVDLAYFKAGKLHEMSGKAQNNPNYKNKTWEQYKKQVQDGRDMETLAKITIVDKFGEKIPEYVDIFRWQVRPSMGEACVKYVFSTVHKFKGLECDTVRLLDDFFYSGLPRERPGLWHETDERGGQVEDEYNLLYVALTRAKRNLVMNDALFYLITSGVISSNYEQLVEINSSPNSKSKPLLCVKCSRKVKISGLSYGLRQVEIYLSGRMRKAGPVCTLCSVARRRKIHYEVGGTIEGAMRIKPGTVLDRGHVFNAPLFKSLDTGEQFQEELENHIERMEEQAHLDHEIRKVKRSEEEEDEDILNFMGDDDSDFLDAFDMLDDDANLLHAVEA